MSVRDKMVAARNRLRLLMGQGPIGITTTPRTMPTTPTPSTPTKMDIARQKLKEELELQRELEEVYNTTDVNPENANLGQVPDDTHIAVTPKSTKGDVDNLNPLVLISPTFPPGSDQLKSLPDPSSTTSTTSTTTSTTTTSLTFTTATTTPKPTMILDDVLDVPTRMQDTLMRLMQKTGLKRDPFAKLVTTAITLIDDEEDFEDFTAPTPHQDPFLTKNLRDHENGVYEGLSTPPTKQDPLLRQLQTTDNHEPIQGLRQPKRKQNPLLNNLRGGVTNADDNLDLPENPLSPDFEGPAQSHNRFNPDGLNLPKRRQNPLLRILRFDRREKILSKGLSPPRYRQNPLFRQLVSTPQKYRNDFLQLPPRQQDKLLAILKRHGGDNFDADALLTVPTLVEVEEEDYEDYDEDYEEFEPVTSVPTPLPSRQRIRPKMPKSKFEVLQIRPQQSPIEEVTFQRVSEPLTLKDKKEGIDFIDCFNRINMHVYFSGYLSKLAFNVYGLKNDR